MARHTTDIELLRHTSKDNDATPIGVDILTRLTALLVILLLPGAPRAAGAEAKAKPGAKAQAPQGMPAGASSGLSADQLRPIVNDVAANEIRAIQHQDSYFRYRMHTVDQKGDRVRDIVECKDGSVARLTQQDGQPLSEEKDRLEKERLNDLLSTPADFARHTHNDATGKKLAVDLIKLMPDAMIYTYTPGQPQLDPARALGSTSLHQLVLDYAPKPGWSPPNTTAEALTGLQGRMWIDIRTHQLVRMESNVFRSVNFGWGVLAHIYPGGKLSLDQAGIDGDRWIFTHFNQDLKVRALMLKTLNVQTTIDASQFQPLPGALSYGDAIRQLLATPPPTH